jgi:hypothetical protein
LSPSKANSLASLVTPLRYRRGSYRRMLVTEGIRRQRFELVI